MIRAKGHRKPTVGGSSKAVKYVPIQLPVATHIELEKIQEIYGPGMDGRLPTKSGITARLIREKLKELQKE